MRKVCIFIATCIAAVGIANGAVRDDKTISRTAVRAITSRNTPETKKVTGRATNKRTVSRTATTKTRTKTQSAHTARNTTPDVTKRPTTVSRSATTPRAQPAKIQTTKNVSRPARAATMSPTAASNTFGTDYNECRAAYFTCMDQFCATANDTYRRCICSSKLSEIQARERALGQTSEQIIDFKNLNLDVINKTAEEVSAMLSATVGETAQASAKDNSDSAKQLAGISEVLSKTKSQSLSTQGTLDIAGNIDAIWSTSNLTGGANIANLTGEALYNAVHAQCSEMVIDKCNSPALQNMITTAYGMYIENDCSALINALDGQKKNANASIRQTEREMQLARLENYKAHNSTSINDCIAQVRIDITADTACGPDYVHCLDVTGLYLNRETGTPLYTANFYQLENMTSLSGDTLTNQSNRLLVAELNRKRVYAERGLDTCRDIADAVWDEFLRQAISEIYQGQQERVRQVKNECLEVVNKCYDEKNKSLKDFSNVKEQLLLGQRIELSEQMCQEKLDACSNLYGGGPNGMAELLIAMHNITTQTISNQCLATLREHARDFCAPPGNDTLHAYPYACRIYKPGDAKYASIPDCNLLLNNIDFSSLSPATGGISYRNCNKIYTSCKANYFLLEGQCYLCPTGTNCDKAGTTYADIRNNKCGNTYIGSLYHKIARYASQACVRPSEAYKTLPATVLQDINTVMDEVHHEMADELSKECQRLGGIWYDTIWQDNDSNGMHDSQNHRLHKKFYTDTAADTDWGYCGTDDINLAQMSVYTITFVNTPQSALYPNAGCAEATPASNAITITTGQVPEKLTESTTTTGQDPEKPTENPVPRCNKPRNTGYTSCQFNGYWDSPDGGAQYFNGTVPVQDRFEKQETNITLYAGWECER